MSISFVDDISSLQVEVTKPFDINLVHIELHAGIIILVSSMFRTIFKPLFQVFLGLC